MLKDLEQRIHMWLLAWADSFRERAKKPVLWPTVKGLLFIGLMGFGLYWAIMLLVALGIINGEK